MDIKFYRFVLSFLSFFFIIIAKTAMEMIAIIPG